MKKIITGILLIAAIVAVGGLVAHEAGYLPVKALLNVEGPENSTLVQEPEYANIVVSIIESIPELDGIKFGVYETELSTEEVMQGYRNSLVPDGYRIYNELEGDETFFAYNYSYAVYLKGITAIGIVSFSADDITYVVYAIGSGFDLNTIYKELMG